VSRDTLAVVWGSCLAAHGLGLVARSDQVVVIELTTESVMGSYFNLSFYLELLWSGRMVLQTLCV
jgi:hypothetical protein